METTQEKRSMSEFRWETIYQEGSNGYGPAWFIETQRAVYEGREMWRLLMTDHNGVQTASGLGFHIPAVEITVPTAVAETPAGAEATGSETEDPFAGILTLQGTEALAEWLDTHCKRRPATRDGKRHWTHHGRWIASVSGLLHRKGTPWEVVGPWDVAGRKYYSQPHTSLSWEEARGFIHEFLECL